MGVFCGFLRVAALRGGAFRANARAVSAFHVVEPTRALGEASPECARLRFLVRVARLQRRRNAPPLRATCVAQRLQLCCAAFVVLLRSICSFAAQQILGHCAAGFSRLKGKASNMREKLWTDPANATQIGHLSIKGRNGTAAGRNPKAEAGIAS